MVGRLRLFLLCSLFRKYLNYSSSLLFHLSSYFMARGEESRASVAPADMQTGITRGSSEAAEAYRRILDLAAILVECLGLGSRLRTAEVGRLHLLHPA